MLLNIEEKYPGMTEFFRIGSKSAQAQTKHAIRMQLINVVNKL